MTRIFGCTGFGGMTAQGQNRSDARNLGSGHRRRGTIALPTPAKNGQAITLAKEMKVDAGAIREKMRAVAGFFTDSEIAPIGKTNHLHQYSGFLVPVGEDTV